MKLPLFFCLFLLLLSLAACQTGNGGGEAIELAGGYQDLMRQFVQDLSAYAKAADPDFVIVPQNGHELMRRDGDWDGGPELDYLAAVDGAGQEDLFYGYKEDNRATPADDVEYLLHYLKVAADRGLPVLAIDYCWTEAKMDDAFAQCEALGFLSFAAPERGVDVIPGYPDPIRSENTDNVSALSDADNFLVLLNPEEWSDRAGFLSDLQATSYDVLIIDAFFGEEAGEPYMFSPAEIDGLKTKAGGGDRLVLSYLSIGEAEDYRYYWNNAWNRKPPSWLAAENPEWEGNYKVRYWEPGWQAVIFGSSEAYLDRILDAGFDGVYLDIIDAFQYFES